MKEHQLFPDCTHLQLRGPFSDHSNCQQMILSILGRFGTMGIDEALLAAPIPCVSSFCSQDSKGRAHQKLPGSQWDRWLHLTRLSLVQHLLKYRSLVFPPNPHWSRSRSVYADSPLLPAEDLDLFQPPWLIFWHVPASGVRACQGGGERNSIPGLLVVLTIVSMWMHKNLQRQKGDSLSCATLLGVLSRQRWSA